MNPTPIDNDLTDDDDILECAICHATPAIIYSLFPDPESCTDDDFRCADHLTR